MLNVLIKIIMVFYEKDTEKDTEDFNEIFLADLQ